MINFETLKKKLTEKAANAGAFNKIIKLELDDHIMALNGNTSPPSVQDNALSPDITITSSIEVFEKLLDKKINPQVAIMTGKIKIKGDILAAMPLMNML